MPREEQLLARHERDRLIVALTKKGYSHSKIAARLHMSRRGVGRALKRIAAEGAREEGDWAPRPVDDDEW
jgi:transposase